MKAYLKFGDILSIFPKLLSKNEILELIKGHYSCTNLRKMKCNNPKLDLVNMKAYIKFGEILSICSQENEQKQHSGVNQGP